MTLQLWSSRMGYKGADWLDISYQGNIRREEAGEEYGHRGMGAAFAPSREILRPYLDKRNAGTLTAEDWPKYVAAYTAEMRVSYREHPRPWAKLLALDEVTALCYCSIKSGEPRHCHRFVLSEIVGKLGAQVMGER